MLFLPGLRLAAQPALSNRVSSYDIRVRLDTREKQLQGTEVVDWTNPSRDTVSELRFHLYMNAFKNNRSSFMKESGQQAGRRNRPGTWGWIDVRSMRLADGTDLTPSISYSQPDDGNTDDQTVIRVPLPEPVLPGKTIRLEMEFLTRLPRIIARTGYSRDFFLIGQWFPKLGVYEPAGTRERETGGWNCHQFHASSEFYADFSNYRVSMTLPGSFRVGATGERIDSVMNADSTQTLTWLARDVVDFAWTAAPWFGEIRDQWNDTRIRILYPPEHADQAGRFLAGLKTALDYFSRALGPYPYPSITVVDPPFHGINAGGMEYPMFITTGTLAGLPAGIHFPELVTVHEFGHNYFMGILATNEAEEAWMDEGMNSYYESLILDDWFGDDRGYLDLPGLPAGSWEDQRLGYTSMSNPRIAPIARKSWEFPEGGYGALSYSKAATMMMTLERLVGKPTMEEIMHTYYRRWKFRHPGGKDFIAVVNEIVRKNHGTHFGEDMNWFFDQVLYGSGVCDYRLALVQNSRLSPPRGVDEISGNKVTYSDIEFDEALYRSRVVVHRLGEVTMPVEIWVEFDDGSTVTENWEGREESISYTYDGPRRAVRAVVDPGRKILLDINYMNNSYAVKPDRSAAREWGFRFLFSVQQAFQFLSLLFA